MSHQKDKEDPPPQTVSSPHLPENNEHGPLSNQHSEHDSRSTDADLSILLENKSHIDHFYIALSPHVKFPPELIEQIFRSIIPSPPLLPLTIHNNNPHLRITQICRSWRVMAFKIPLLWNISLDKVPTTGTVNLIASWFRQCSSTQICLHGTEDLGPYNEDLEIKKYISEQIIIPYANRIKELYMFPFHRYNLTSLPMNVLTTLTLDCTEPSPPVKNIVAPLLRCVHLRNVSPSGHISIFDSAPELPWGQLKVLSLEGYLSMTILLDILIKCTSLEYLHVRNLEYDLLDDDPIRACNLPYLKELHIGFTNCVSFERLFLFKVPCLTSLSVSHPLSPLDYLEGFSAFVKEVKNSLRRFEITRSWSYDTTYPLKAILGSVPFVIHFSAKEDILPAIICKKIGTGELLPNVEVLHLRLREGESWEENLNVLIPPEQQDGLSQLRELYFYINEAVRSTQPRIQELHAQGIDVHLVHPTCKYHIGCQKPDCQEQVAAWIFGIEEHIN
ncbi:hypothetical protein BDZ94DRAFT_1313105 [Collybia nuda]|uniref:F-box domain-containing protein n=1 Tax=Collybia nuda TaxID=64659 RepID=A0A9P5XZL6_9AGAR|nr:hypothetical protein BDZ94DRAFT_1313105 [Collybia nuda]